jgi:hypothetical protein
MRIVLLRQLLRQGNGKILKREWRMTMGKAFKFTRRHYYDLCCDVVNLIENNYDKDDKKMAYEFAMSELKKLDKEERRRPNDL